MHIMTTEGWKPIHIPNVIPPIHVPSLLEQFGIDPNFDGIENYHKAVQAYLSDEISLERCLGEMSRKR